jgi:hypothetical protein
VARSDAVARAGRREGIAISLSFAAACAAASIAWFTLWVRPLQQRLARAEAERTSAQARQHDLEREVSELRGDRDGNMIALQRERDRRIALEQEQSSAPLPSPAPVIVARADLVSHRTREAGRIATIAIPAGATGVALLRLMGAPVYAEYQAVLQNPAGEQLWPNRGTFSFKRGTKQAVLELTVPAAVLAPGDYIVRLSGLGAGDSTYLGSYQFRAARP